MVENLRCTGLALWAACTMGCYVGFSGSEPGAQTDGAGSGATADDGDSGGDSAGDGDDPSAAACQETDVALSGMRRLSRLQYANSVRDLLGVEVDLSTLPIDEEAESAGPFPTNILAPVSELGVREYMEVAEDVVSSALAQAQPAITTPGELLPCDPVEIGEQACAQEFIAEFGLRAFRRPLSDDEVADYEAIFQAGAEMGGFGDGIGFVVESMLQSPYFLYLVEFGAAEGEPVTRLGDFELASRLSYFLWSSTPDDALLEAAQRGDLATNDGVRAQAERLIESPAARTTIATFHTQWLRADEVVTAAKVPDVYPEFDAELAAMMLRETELFADYVVREGDGRLATILTAPFTIAEPRLAALYGVAEADIGDDGRIELDATQRVGLLMQASVLSVHAHADQASPIRRGVLIRRNVLCQPLPPPPPDADVTAPPLDPNLPTRERFDAHRAEPSCMGCHELIDSIGYAFLGFDGVGQRILEDGGEPVDTSGKVTSSDLDPSTFDNPVELAHALADSDQVRDCVASQWMTFALGHPAIEEGGDACAVETIKERFNETDGDIADLLIAITTSDAFLNKRLVAKE